LKGVGSRLDILPTAAWLCGAPLPPKPLDGINIWPLLCGEAEQIDREVLLYFDSLYLQCARWGKWKLHIARYDCPPYVPPPAEILQRVESLIPGFPEEVRWNYEDAKSKAAAPRR
jgi:hypothetical protein